MPRWLALLFVLPQCTGCLYYAYPTVAHTPDLVIDNHDGGAHAFRVDIDRTERKPAATATEATTVAVATTAKRRATLFNLVMNSID